MILFVAIPKSIKPDQYEALKKVIADHLNIPEEQVEVDYGGSCNTIKAHRQDELLSHYLSM